MTKDQVLQSAKSLPKGDRIELALELWESIEVEGNDLPVTDAMKRELDRRIAADTGDQQPAEDWADLKQKLLKGDF